MPILAFLMLITLIAPSLAWFAKKVNFSKDPNGITGSTAAAYFESGNGTAQSPYIISNPTHLYNLAWLQYMGYFNMGSPLNNGKDQSYFQLANDIDMKVGDTSLVLPPIGTTEYPFIGNFDGNGFKITNAVTANISEALEHRPDNAQFKAGDAVNGLLSEYVSKAASEVAQFIGFFGVIGSFSGEKTASTNVESSVINVRNFTLNDYRVSSSSSWTIVGFVAGYVNAKLENVQVNNCTLETVSGAKGIENVSGNLSNHALVGYCTSGYEKTLSSGTVTVYDPKISSSPLGSGAGTGPGGDQAGWGGSMDMVSLVRRLTYMLGENKGNSKNYPVSFTDGYSSTFDLIDYAYTPSSVDDTGAKIAYLGEKTTIPLNVDIEEMFKGDDKELTSGRVKYKTNNYYNNYSEESILNSNTGYIVGGGSGSGVWVRTRIQAIKGAGGGIEKSISDGDTVDFDEAKKTSNLIFYTVAPGATKSSIADSNNFKKYAEVTNNFAKIMHGKKTISGLRFYANDNNGINVKETVLISGKTTADVLLNGVTRTDYEMVNGAINFHLSESGYITAIAGTYATNTGTAHSLFSLYKVERNEENVITSVTKIENIYVNTSNDKAILYNQDKENPPMGYTLAFDSTAMNNLETHSSAYYFEIPVSAGDYALGSAVGETDGAYLLYLDIGANAGGSGEGDETVTRTVIAEQWSEKGTKVTYALGVGLGGSVLSFTVPEDNKGQEINFSRTDDTVAVTYKSNNVTVTDGSKVTENYNPDKLTISGAVPLSGSTTVTVKRLTVIDTKGGVVQATATFTWRSDGTTESTGGATGVTISESGVTFTMSNNVEDTIPFGADNTAVLVYDYNGEGVSYTLAFTLNADNATCSYVATVSATGETTVEVTTKNNGAVATDVKIEAAGENVTITDSSQN